MTTLTSSAHSASSVSSEDEDEEEYLDVSDDLRPLEVELTDARVRDVVSRSRSKSSPFRVFLDFAFVFCVKNRL